jgi:transposase
MTRKPRTTFSTEFKREAVQLLEQGDKDAAQLARELGVRRNQLYKWKAEIDSHGAAAFPGGGRRQRQNDETAQLKKEVARLEEENDILKKAARYFARELG